MRIARLQIGTIGFYLVAVTLATYVGLGANERFTPGWGVTSSLFVPLMALHLAVGAIVGRWWAAVLPLGWVLLALPAGDWPIPVSGIVAVQAVLLWAPAILLGVTARKFTEPSGRTLPHATVAFLVIAPLAGGYALLSKVAEDPGSAIPSARYASIDEARGTYGGVGIGAPLEAVLAVHGRNSHVSGNQTTVPKDAVKVRDGDLGWSGHSNSAWWYCYDDVCFWLGASPKREPKKATVGGIVLASPGATTLRGVQVGDALDDAPGAYPEVRCRTEAWGENPYGFGGYRICTGLLPGDRAIWFGGDPINVIIVSSTSLAAGITG